MSETATLAGSAPASAAPVTLFYSYAHEDEALREELQGHLKLLERRGLIAPWHDRKIVAGADWGAEIDLNLTHAELVLLLVSKDFIESDYIMGVELAAAMRRHAEHAATVVPIIVRAVDLEPEDADDLPFLKLQGLPTDLRPVTSWPNRDEAWTNVAKGLRGTVKAIRERRSPAVPAAAPASGRPSAEVPFGHTVVLGVPPPGLPTPTRSEAPPHGAAPASPARPDALLERVVDAVATQIDAAQRARVPAPLDARAAQAVRAETRTLIDLREQQRVLWVDDRPEGNRHEATALAKLQIEIVTARSTDEAMRIVAADREGYSLVISDWERAGEPAQAGLRLLARLRQAGVRAPVIYYHGEFGPRRAGRAAQARAAGAFGEAVLPAELMALVARALGGGPFA